MEIKYKEFTIVPDTDLEGFYLVEDKDGEIIKTDISFTIEEAKEFIDECL